MIKQHIQLIENIISEATIEYQDKEYDIALLTLDEYLKFRNPTGKMHGGDSYDFDIDKLNKHYKATDILVPHFHWLKSKSNEVFEVIRYHANTSDPLLILIKHLKTDEPAGFYYKDIIYYDPTILNKDDIELNFQNVKEKLGIKIKKYEKIKYPHRKFNSIVYQGNIDRYKKVIKRTVLNGEEITVRRDKYDELAAFNDKKQKVAIAQDEWGALLVSVAREYRGIGLGKLMQKLYIDMFPDKKSGGFTQDGLNNAIGAWASAVRDYLAKGFYSELIKRGKISKERVEKILNDLPERRSNKELISRRNEKTTSKPDYLIFHDGYRSFILYDKKFIENQDEQYIYAFCLVNLDTKGEEYIYRLEYEEKEHEKLILYVTLQQLKNKGLKVKTKAEPSDYYETSYKFIEEDDGYIYLTKDVIPNIDAYYQKEQQLRNKADEYNEIYHLLLEMAEYKW